MREAVVPIALRAVQRRGGMLDERFGVQTVAGKDADPDRRGDVQDISVDLQRLSDRREELARDELDFGRPGRPRKKHEEFVARRSRNRVVAAKALLQARGDGLEDLVSDSMSERIVHLVEAVDVDDEHREIEPLRARIADDVFETLEEGPAVRQAGQAVEGRARGTATRHSLLPSKCVWTCRR
jgi:hypothetical protein